jgi:NADH-quinone oxidoreductase subunit G
MSRRNDAVNGWFICDRGRFGNAPVNDPARPRTPLLDGGDAGWDDALDALVTRIVELNRVHGSGSLALVGSPRLAHEGAALLPRLAALLGAGFLCYFTDQQEGDRAVTAVSQLNCGNTASMADVQGSDCIVVLSSELLEEGPLMALAVRQAWRKGAKVFIVGGSSAQEWTKAVAIETVVTTSTLSAVPFADYKRPVIVCGTQQNDSLEIEKAAQAGAKVAYLFSGPNALGAALLAKEHGTTTLSQAVGSGKVKGILAIEADIPVELIKGVSFVAAADWLSSGLVARADIFLPTTSWVEMDGTYINNEGRGQHFQQVMKPGLPIKGLDPALHPPRVHRSVPQGGDLRPAWQVIARLIQKLGGENITEPLAGRWEKLGNLSPEGEGMRIL